MGIYFIDVMVYCDSLEAGKLYKDWFVGDWMKELDGANMDIDFIPADVSWEQGVCPWNGADFGLRLVGL